MKLPVGPRHLWGENPIEFGSGVDKHDQSTALRRFGRVLRNNPGLTPGVVTFTYDENGDFEEAYLYASSVDRNAGLYPACEVALTEIAFGEVA